MTTFHEITFKRYAIFTQTIQVALADDEDPEKVILGTDTLLEPGDDSLVIDLDALDWEHHEFIDLETEPEIIATTVIERTPIDFQSKKSRSEERIKTRSESFSESIRRNMQQGRDV